MSGSTAPAIPTATGGGHGGPKDPAVFNGFINAVKKGGVTNPYALAAIAATGQAESGYSASNASGDWQDGQNRAGGIMSWNGPRLAALRKFNGGSNGSPEQQAAYFLQEDPDLIKKLNNAKSLEEAQALMNGAWRYTGYNPAGDPQGNARLATAKTFLPQFQGSGATVATDQPTGGTTAKGDGSGSESADTTSTDTTKTDDQQQPKRVSPKAGIPEQPQQTSWNTQPQPVQQAALVAPEDEWGQQPIFAARGGVIPEPEQRFQDGGAPVITPPVVNPGNPSAVDGVDRYNQTRSYTQAFTPSSPPTAQARRVSFPSTTSSTYQPMQLTDGMTPSQLAVKQAQDKLAADRAAAAAAKPAAAAPAPAAQQQQRQSSPWSYGIEGGGGSGQWRNNALTSGWYPNPQGRPATQRGYANGGAIPETLYADGGAVSDRDKRFRELLRQETPLGPQVGDREGGESARDRAARRLSAMEGRPSSTAYSEHPEYWQPAKKGGGRGKVDKTPTGSADKPIQEDRATRERGAGINQEDRATRDRSLENVAIPLPDDDRSTRFRPEDLVAPATSTTSGVTPATGAMSPTSQPNVIPPPVQVDPTRPYVPPGGGVTRRVEPLYIHKADEARRTGEASRAARDRLRIQQQFPQAKISGVVADPNMVNPPTGGPVTPSGGSQPAAPSTSSATPVDAARTARDVGATRSLMESVTSPPIEYSDTPTDDSGSVDDQSAWQQIKHWFGFAAGGAIPEPGEPGYNEYVAAGGTATTPTGGAPSGTDSQTTASLPPPDTQRMRPTPRLMDDVAKALHGGINFLQNHFGLNQGGAVQTPEGQQAQQDGMRRFASGEGAATQQEVDGIDDKIDPQRQMSEADRNMTRTAKVMQWYLERGRKTEAEAAAAGLMQYGAQRFGQIGSLAAAAYSKYLQSGDPRDLDNTTKALQSAYQYIPDGGSLGIQLDPDTHKLEITHTDADGNDQTLDVRPEDLPGIIKSVQDKSMYWNQIMTLADPEGARAKATRAQSQADWQHEHDITRQEKLADAKAAAEAELAKEGRTQQYEKDKEKRAAEQKKIEQQEANKEDDRRRLRDASITRANELLKAQNDIQWDKVNPLIDAVTDAHQADDADTDAGKQRINEAESRLFDALPAKTREQNMQTLGYSRSDFKYVPATTKAMVASGDTPPTDYTGKQPGDQVKKGTAKDGTPIWVVVRNGQQFALPAQ